MERGWLGEKRGQGFYKRVGKARRRRSRRSTCKTLEYHPGAEAASFPRWTRRASIEDLPRAAARAGGGERPRRQVPLAAVPRLPDLLGADGARRSPTASWRSIAPCAGATASHSGRSSCGTRSASPKRRERMEARGLSRCRRMCERMLAAGRESFYEPADRDGEPGTRYFDLERRQLPGRSSRGPAWSCWAS